MSAGIRAPRPQVLATLAQHLAAHPVRREHPLRVAVDGVTGAGKSTFASELAVAVSAAGAPALHLSADDFHHRTAHRRRDPDRARGYYRDAYDLPALRRLVLDPLGAGRPYRPRLHDLASDEILHERPLAAPEAAVVVVDGTFLQVPALQDAWDVVIWLDTAIPVAEDRAVARDAALFGGAEPARAAYRDRYHAACRLYLADVRPAESADVVVENDELAAPVLRVLRAPEHAGGPVPPPPASP